MSEYIKLAKKCGATLLETVTTNGLPCYGITRPELIAYSEALRAKDKEEIEVIDKLLAEQYKVIDAIPPCILHGNRCVPHAIEWVSEAKIVIGRQEKLEGEHLENVQKLIAYNKQLQFQLAATQLVVEQMREALETTCNEIDSLEGRDNSCNPSYGTSEYRKILALQVNTDALRKHDVGVITKFKRELSSIQEDASCLCTTCWQHAERLAGKAINELRATKKEN